MKLKFSASAFMPAVPGAGLHAFEGETEIHVFREPTVQADFVVEVIQHDRQQLPPSAPQDVESAVAEERERCAQIVENHGDSRAPGGNEFLAGLIRSASSKG